MQVPIEKLYLAYKLISDEIDDADMDQYMQGLWFQDDGTDLAEGELLPHYMPIKCKELDFIKEGDDIVKIETSGYLCPDLGGATMDLRNNDDSTPGEGGLYFYFAIDTCENF